MGRGLAAFADLTSDDLDAIREATRTAEARTGGELVCVLVRRCDLYESVAWKGSCLGAIAGVSGVTLWQTLATGWGVSSPYLFALVALLGAAVGFVATAASPGLKRLLIPRPVLDRRADRRAAAAFVEEEIFDTRDRTGILLFVAFFEHRVRILADKGIEAQVDANVWADIAAELTRGMRAGKARQALLTAIEACGAVLEESVARRHDDANELRDEPRLRDE